jgi:hypothetical protein
MDKIRPPLSKWVDSQKECRRVMESMSNLKSKLTFLDASTNTTESAMDGLSSSRLAVRVLDDINDSFNTIASHQDKMLSYIATIRKEVLDNKNTMPIDHTFFVRLADEIEQQTLLEMNLRDRLMGVSPSDRDAMLTMLTCFAYLPCISNLKHITAVLNCQEI